jgi:ketosteroid isomerase-like protein
MAQPIPAQHMEHVIHTYIQACNAADATAIAACFCPEAVHYLPPPRHKWVGAGTIGSHFATSIIGSATWPP